MSEQGVLLVVAAALAGFAFSGNADRGLVLAPAGVRGPSLARRIAAQRERFRRRLVSLRHSLRSERALFDAVGVLVEHLQSGGSIDDGIAAVRKGSQGDAIGSAFEHLADRLELGVAFTDAVHLWADEIGTVDARLVAATLVMHRRSGGSLAPTLKRVMDAVSERLEIEAEIRSLTAQARLSAWIVGSLPIGFLVFLTLISGPSIVATFLRPVGAAVLVIGVVLEGSAVIWMRRILDVSA